MRLSLILYGYTKGTVKRVTSVRSTDHIKLIVYRSLSLFIIEVDFEFEGLNMSMVIAREFEGYAENNIPVDYHDTTDFHLE